MAGLSFPYQPLGRQSLFPETTSTALAFPSSTGDCLDFMNCVCVMFPLETVLHEDVTPSTTTANTYYSPTSLDHGSCKSNVEEEEQVLNTSVDDDYNLTPLADDPPIHYATTDRQYGMCPLGHQETIYFKKQATN